MIIPVVSVCNLPVAQPPRGGQKGQIAPGLQFLSKGPCNLSVALASGGVFHSFTQLLEVYHLLTFPFTRFL